jgi:hypothetical protein
MIERHSSGDQKFHRQMVRDWYGDLAARIGVGTGLGRTVVEVYEQHPPVVGISTTVVFIGAAYFTKHRMLENVAQERYEVNPKPAARERIHDSMRDVHSARLYGEAAGLLGAIVPETPSLPWKVGLGLTALAAGSEAVSRLTRIRTQVTEALADNDGQPHPLRDRDK